MATRTTLWKAQKLQAQLEQTYPDRTFTIQDKSEIRRVGRAVALAHGYQILDDGTVTVLANATQFDVLEVRKCACGQDIYTSAIGEDGKDECSECSRRQEMRQAHEGREQERRSAESVRRHVAFDEHSERGY